MHGSMISDVMDPLPAAHLLLLTVAQRRPIRSGRRCWIHTWEILAAWVHSPLPLEPGFVPDVGGYAGLSG